MSDSASKLRTLAVSVVNRPQGLADTALVAEAIYLSSAGIVEALSALTAEVRAARSALDRAHRRSDQGEAR